MALMKATSMKRSKLKSMKSMVRGSPLHARPQGGKGRTRAQALSQRGVHSRWQAVSVP
jgi:hypothetical protein